MEEQKFNKLRFYYIQKIYNLNKNIRFQDWERNKGSSEQRDLRHYLLHNILKGKSHFTLIQHNELLRYSIENNSLTEIRFDLDYKEFETTEENLKVNLKLGFDLYLKLLEKGIKPFFYSSGGKGIHCSFLLSTEGLNFKTNIENIDLEQYEKQFVEKKGDILDLLNKSNQERTNFKRLFYSWLNLDEELKKVLDFQMLSSHTLLTLEGAKKRGQGKRYKTFIDYSKFTLDKLYTYILENNKPYIEYKFLETINRLSKAQIEEIFNLSTKDIPKPIKNQSEALNSTIDLNFNHLDKDTENKAKSLIIAMLHLVKRKNIQSLNSIYFKVAKMLLVETKNKEVSLNYLIKFYELNTKNKKSIDWFEDKINNSQTYLRDKKNFTGLRFMFKDYFTEQEFFKEYNFLREALK